jgi:cytochrome c peroxidase
MANRPGLPSLLLACVLAVAGAPVAAVAGSVQAAARPAAAAVPAFTAGEVRRIVALGPWPQALPADPSNRVADLPAAAEFGRRMFHEPRLSANGYVACVTCHQTDRAFTDAIARARALAPVERNTPSLVDVALNPWFGWAGASDSLWMASLRPILDAREMGVDAAAVARVVRTGIGLACEYRRAFGRAPDDVDDETVLVDVAKALAAFQRTLASARTPFDDLRDALAHGDTAAVNGYPPAALRGLRLFVGRAGCVQCHAGARFSDGSFRALAAPAAPAAPVARRPGPVAALGPPADAGRAEAVRSLAASPYNLLGRFNDAPQGTGARAAATRALAAEALPPGHFRVPTLRNVAATPPYFHDGSRATLLEAVRHADGRSLAARDADDLVAFLHTLGDAPGARRAPLRPGDSDCH